MDPHNTLRIVTYVGLSVSFLAAVISQLWKSSVEVEGTIRKRLTPAGWIWLAISLIGLLAGVLAEVIRSQTQSGNGQNNPQLLLASTQPLTSLSLHLQFSSTDPKLWKTIQDGEREIHENDESTQGGVPETSYEEMDYEAVLLPLLSFIARVGTKSDHDDVNDYGSGPPDKRSIAVLVPLDDSRNAILSFGEIGTRVSWFKASEASALSAGFYTSHLRKEPRRGSSIPRVSTTLSKTVEGTSTYRINWDLDPATLAGSIDRMNSAVQSTTKLPTALKIAVFFDMGTLPFKEADFAVNYVDLWDTGDYGRTAINIDGALKDLEFSMTVNGSRELTYTYRLTRIYRQKLLYKGVDEVETRCTILEFQAL